MAIGLAVRLIYIFMTIKSQWKLMKMDLVMEILNTYQKDKKQLGREFIRIDSYKKDF